METSALNAALEYLDRGWACIPVNPETGVCPFAWGYIADKQQLPSEDDIYEWFGELYPNYNVAIITGPVSNLVVVDCDNANAVKEAEKLGLTRTPIVVETKKGFHFYFAFPKNEGWIKSHVGANCDGREWPSVAGLDLRGSKGIAYAPPSVGKSWRLMQGADFDDIPVYVRPKLAQPEQNVVNLNEFRLEQVSLAGVRPEGHGVWERTAADVDRLGRKIDAGDGCHARLVSLVGECFAQGLDEQAIHTRVHEYMDTFMLNPFDDKKVLSTIDDISKSDQRNHPDRDNPVPVAKEDIEPEKDRRPRVITTKDIERLEDELGTVEYFVEPFIPTSGTIFQIHGFSGHGKSTFARHLLYACAAGNDRFGPFQFYNRPRVLYCDFENSRSNVVKFLTQAKHSYGDASQNFMLWCPFDNEEMMNLKSAKGLATFEYLVKSHRPNIVIIDTVRSAFPSMAENSADDWSHINQLCLSLRNGGISVGLLHHSNKPSDGAGSAGREAGSTNQLTVLETQLKVTQVFEDQATAQVRAGLWDGDIINTPMAVMGSPQALKAGERLDMMFEVRYGKVREMTDVHMPFYHIGMGSNYAAGTVRPISAKTPKQRAMMYAQEWEDNTGVMRTALSDFEISQRINQPVHMVKEWTEALRATNHASRLAEAKSNR